MEINPCIIGSVVKMGSWQVEKTLYKHSAGVTALALHPTGKLAFSAGKDKKLITWNLVKVSSHWRRFLSILIADWSRLAPPSSRTSRGSRR